VTTRPRRPTRAELLVDEASDLVELLEVGGLEERQEVPHVGLLPGHGGGAGEGGGWGQRLSRGVRP